MNVFILKACPKCKGDLAAETNIRRITDDTDVACIQCGYTLPLALQQRLFARLFPRAQTIQPAPVPVYARR